MTTVAMRHPDRGWVHAVPVLAFVVGALAYPLYVLVATFRIADADIATRPGAPFAAAAVAAIALLAGVLIASFVTMVAYAVCRSGSTRLVRGAQVAGLGLTGIGCGAGIWLAIIVAEQLA
ncbi:hypothetical protein [Janibacter limosus]|uniref:Uncharacterized protein n=1 Tax=Janibacter limosus TaxID=53458 RepID=A0A4P6MRM6_9MICO|nr:hypothetical protein [Janibacter limosus]QBF46311.1 hypothetical protein EXU32_08635 [Janibacter limosus]